ncbi:STAS domain-containing protein [Kibdelosporangium philippinense]|uniref:Anti-sigma factor antagonist n=1 Tax=Kibdelosporangium philippinense TaxID=211113 RepID=A0ABS8Z3N4_9PSEU|nr:STAS domain-containing protein [Kibdelosporangium philippinense]MCE7002536.1 STAS domain-containing protein [Kibdelosporangium philippinense]
MSTDIMTVSTSHDGGIAVVHVAGEVDMSSVAPFADAVRDALAERPTGLVIDLLEVTFCGSPGLHVLVEARDGATTSDIEMCVVAVKAPVLRPLDISGLTPLFHMRQSVPDAVKELAA